MKNHENPNQVLNSTFKLHSQMNIHTLIIYFFIFASGLIIGITLNFSNIDISLHSQFSQLSSSFSPSRISPSNFISNDTKAVMENDSKESNEQIQTMPIEPKENNEMPQTMPIEPKESNEQPQSMHIEPKESNEQPQTMPIESKENNEQPQTMPMEPKESNEQSQAMPIEPNETEDDTSLAFDDYPERIERMHNMSDHALISRALSADHENEENEIVPKIAFMFLTRGELHLAPLWDLFFKGHEEFYTIYVHTQPDFNGTFPENSAFHGRRIPSKKVEWGKFNMVEAEKRLLANALLDTSNQRFVLLSESCIPLFNFSTIYSYLLNSTQTFVESYDLPGPVGRGRYNHHMQPKVQLAQWRKGSQWFQMDRELAVEVIADHKYMALFKRFCKPSCYADEHYIPTFVSMFFWEKNSNRTLTWVEWPVVRGPHPLRFTRNFVTVDLLRRMRSGKKCMYNGQETSVCFMFARKFLPNSLSRLVRFAPKVMEF